MILKLEWPKFERDLRIHLEKGNNTIEGNSKKIAELYHRTVSKAVPKQVPGFSPFLNKFLTLSPAPALPPTTPWVGTGPGLPPVPPATTLPSGILPYLVPPAVIFPGTPSPLNIGLHKAFHQMEEKEVAKLCRKALEDHAKTISGVLAATIPPPGVPPAPAPPLPWVGIE